MQYFELTARVILMAAAVLVGATIVRNVTSALTLAVHGQPAMMQSAAAGLMTHND